MSKKGLRIGKGLEHRVYEDLEDPDSVIKEPRFPLKMFFWLKVFCVQRRVEDIVFCSQKLGDFFPETTCVPAQGSYQMSQRRIQGEELSSENVESVKERFVEFLSKTQQIYKEFGIDVDLFGLHGSRKCLLSFLPGVIPTVANLMIPEDSQELMFVDPALTREREGLYHRWRSKVVRYNNRFWLKHCFGLNPDGSEIVSNSSVLTPS